MKFGTLHQILNPVTVTWPKIAIFKIQDGGGRHLEIRFLAITHRPVVRFQWNFVRGNRMAGRQGLHDKNCNFFKIQHGGPPPFWKIIKLPYLNEKSSDFDEIWYTTSDIEPGCSHVTKNCIFWNSRWRRPPSWKSLFGHYSLTDCPISAKFCMRKQNGMLTKATGKNANV